MPMGRGAPPSGPGERMYPVEIESVECSAAEPGRVVVLVAGKRSDQRRSSHKRMRLVVEEGVRRYRFPALSDAGRAPTDPPEAWAAAFAVPAWLQPRLDEHASLSVDGVNIPLHATATAPENGGQPVDDFASAVAPEDVPKLSARDREVARLQAERDALAAELISQARQERSERERWELEVRELHDEVVILRGELTERGVVRTSALREATQLRIELDRLATDLTAARRELAAQSGGLGEAQALLAELRAVTTRMSPAAEAATGEAASTP